MGVATYHCKQTSNIDIYPSTSWGGGVLYQLITGNFIKKIYFVNTPWKIIIPWGIVWGTYLQPTPLCPSLPPSLDPPTHPHHTTTHPPQHTILQSPTLALPSTPPHTPQQTITTIIYPTTYTPQPPTHPNHTTTNPPPIYHHPTHPSIPSIPPTHPPHEPSNHPPTETKWGRNA